MACKEPAMNREVAKATTNPRLPSSVLAGEISLALEGLTSSA
jgi:hypothetical protein